MTEQIFWLAVTLYHECRGEPYEGMVGVAHVILTRAEARKIPVKDVVLQPSQFSCYNGNQRPAIRDYESYIRCVKAAKQAIKERLDGKTFYGADHYFADYISVPEWAEDMQFISKIGKHLFYKG